MFLQQIIFSINILLQEIQINGLTLIILDLFWKLFLFLYRCFWYLFVVYIYFISYIISLTIFFFCFSCFPSVFSFQAFLLSKLDLCFAKASFWNLLWHNCTNILCVNFFVSYWYRNFLKKVPLTKVEEWCSFVRAFSCQGLLNAIHATSSFTHYIYQGLS